VPEYVDSLCVPELCNVLASVFPVI
jgi:hypothetical protein